MLQQYDGRTPATVRPTTEGPTAAETLHQAPPPKKKNTGASTSMDKDKRMDATYSMVNNRRNTCKINYMSSSGLALM
jgi:hypothetical protein